MTIAPGSLLSAATDAEAASPWHPPRWVVPLFGLAALLLVPWVVLLVAALPSAHRAAHWDIAWAGFDVWLALLLLTVAVAAWRRSPWLEGAATATATLLFVDAWFDLLTSRRFLVPLLNRSRPAQPRVWLGGASEPSSREDRLSA